MKLAKQLRTYTEEVICFDKEEALNLALIIDYAYSVDETLKHWKEEFSQQLFDFVDGKTKTQTTKKRKNK